MLLMRIKTLSWISLELFLWTLIDFSWPQNQPWKKYFLLDKGFQIYLLFTLFKIPKNLFYFSETKFVIKLFFFYSMRRRKSFFLTKWNDSCREFASLFGLFLNSKWVFLSSVSSQCDWMTLLVVIHQTWQIMLCKVLQIRWSMQKKPKCLIHFSTL